MKALGSIISMVGLYLVYSVTFGSSGRMSGFDIDWGFAIPVMVLGFGIAALGGYVSQLGLEEAQQRPVGDNYLDALYLRPFDLDSKFIVSRQSNAFDWDQHDRPGVDGWERVLADALSGTAALRGLGAPGDVKLGPRLEGFTENWQNEIGSWLARSDYVFVIPSANPGTLWELRQIKEWNLFNKTIFIMPPTSYPFEYKGNIPFPEVWLGTVETCRTKLQLELPPYDAAGALFRFQDGHINIKALTAYTPKAIAKAVNSLL